MQNRLENKSLLRSHTGNYTITVTDDDRLSITNSDRTKKKKANTPLRSNFPQHDDEIQFKSKKNLY